MEDSGVLPKIGLAVLVALSSALLSHLVYSLTAMPLVFRAERGNAAYGTLAFAVGWIFFAWLMTRRVRTRAQLLRRVERVVVISITLTLLPTLLLYAADLATGTPSRGLGWAAAMAVALAGLWLALRQPRSRRNRTRLELWLTIGALAVAAVMLPLSFWESLRAGGASFTGGVVEFGATGVAIHHIVRLSRQMRTTGGRPNDTLVPGRS